MFLEELQALALSIGVPEQRELIAALEQTPRDLSSLASSHAEVQINGQGAGATKPAIFKMSSISVSAGMRRTERTKERSA
jgi:hypothetical protein